jgi:hypothetical protein
MRTRLHLPNPQRRANRTRGAARPVVVAQPEPDLDACKVREAGGPLDVAAYVCLCGFAFAAAVSTSVECPHCGAPQAW